MKEESPVCVVGAEPVQSTGRCMSNIFETTPGCNAIHTCYNQTHLKNISSVIGMLHHTIPGKGEGKEK